MTDRVLIERARHERMRDLLADPLVAEVTRYLPAGELTDHAAVALLVYLQKRKRQLWTEAHALTRDWNRSADEMVIVVPEHELPLPDQLDSVVFLGMHVRWGPEGGLDPCRVALEGNRFPAHATPTWVRAR